VEAFVIGYGQSCETLQRRHTTARLAELDLNAQFPEADYRQDQLEAAVKPTFRAIASQELAKTVVQQTIDLLAIDEWRYLG
jgi:hypothetical protein